MIISFSVLAKQNLIPPFNIWNRVVMFDTHRFSLEASRHYCVVFCRYCSVCFLVLSLIFLHFLTHRLLLINNATLFYKVQRKRLSFFAFFVACNAQIAVAYDGTLETVVHSDSHHIFVLLYLLLRFVNFQLGFLRFHVHNHSTLVH